MRLDEGECPLTLTLSHQGREDRERTLSTTRGERTTDSPLPRRERTKVRVAAAAAGELTVAGRRPILWVVSGNSPNPAPHTSLEDPSQVCAVLQAARRRNSQGEPPELHKDGMRETVKRSLAIRRMIGAEVNHEDIA